MLPQKKNVKLGDCESCDQTNIEITLHYNIWMCDACWQKELAVVPTTKLNEVNLIIEKAKQIDNSIQIKSDIWNAETVAAKELYAAVQQDENIPQDQKDYAYTKLSAERVQKFQKVVFDQRQELLENENKLRMWQVNTQEAAGKLRTELREQFKQFDVNYQPVTPKTVKPTKTPSPKTASVKASKVAAAKYGVDVVGVQLIAQAKNISPDDAAKWLFEQTQPKQ